MCLKDNPDELKKPTDTSYEWFSHRTMKYIKSVSMDDIAELETKIPAPPR